MSKNTKIPGFILIIFFIVSLLGMIAKLALKVISELLPFVAIAMGVLGVVYLSYILYVYFYFRSKRFLEVKEGISKYIENCNKLNHHIAELRNSFFEIKSFDYGKSELLDNSSFNYKRSEWAKAVKNEQVYNCSASIVKNANSQPFKYLCKYFNIDSKEETLEQFESLFNDFSAAEEGKLLLKNERDTILNNIKISIPWLIFKYNRERLERELGFEDFEFDEIYFPIYRFQYVSAGGNSSSSCDIELDISNLERFVNYLNGLVSFRKSVAGQRALMTTKLREWVKMRDNFTCQKCSISIEDERNLLLEIDHIIPISKGGVTTEQNLQTLCWRCNRTKGAKIEF